MTRLSLFLFQNVVFQKCIFWPFSVLRYQLKIGISTMPVLVWRDSSNLCTANNGLINGLNNGEMGQYTTVILEPAKRSTWQPLRWKIIWGTFSPLMSMSKLQYHQRWNLVFSRLLWLGFLKVGVPWFPQGWCDSWSSQGCCDSWSPQGWCDLVSSRLFWLLVFSRLFWLLVFSRLLWLGKESWSLAPNYRGWKLFSWQGFFDRFSLIFLYSFS